MSKKVSNENPSESTENSSPPTDGTTLENAGNSTDLTTTTTPIYSSNLTTITTPIDSSDLTTITTPINLSGLTTAITPVNSADESNFPENKINSLLNSKINAKEILQEIKINVQKENTSARFRIEDLNLSSKQSKDSSRGVKHAKSIKLNSKQQRMLKNLKRNLRRAIKAKSIATMPMKRNSLTEFVDVMFEIYDGNIPPSMGIKQQSNLPTSNTSNLNQSAAAPNLSALFNDANPRTNRRMYNSYNQSPSLNPFSTSTQSTPNYSPSARPVFNTNSMPFNSANQSNSLLNRNESIEMRIVYIFEQITNVLDRILRLINDFREELSEIQGREAELNRALSTENNSMLLNMSLLMDAVTNTLPDRLSERFGRELERNLSKFFGDKKRK